MFSILQSLLCQEPFPLHLNIQGFRYIWDQQVNQLAHTEHNVLKDDDKGELECKDLPMDRGQDSLVVAESTVITFLLKLMMKIFDKSKKYIFSQVRNFRI